jgi:AraC-like DNA-binding protein
VRLDPPFDLLRARFVRQQFVPHSHDEYAIGVITRGIGRLVHALGDELHPPGGLITISPGLVHTGAAVNAAGWSYRMLYLPQVYLERAAVLAGYREGTQPWFERTSFVDAPLSKRVAALHRALESHAGHPARLLPRLIATLAVLIRAHARVWNPASLADRAAARAVRSARAFIDAEFLRPLTIEEVSKAVGLSQSYLIRAFHRTYGMPPYVYLEHLRVRHARTLIEHGIPISAAALMARFSDQSHLTRRFKRTFGITPGAYALRVRDPAKG